MPRSGPPDYLATQPSGTTAVPGTPISSAAYNTVNTDIYSIFNGIQPVPLGGTGATSAAGARANLGLIIGTDIPGLASANIWTAANTFRLSDDGATAGPTLTLDRLSATPAASDLIAQLTFSGRDSGAGTEVYGAIGAQIVDPTAASEDGRLLFKSVIAGSLGIRAYLGNGLYTVGASDNGADSISGANLYASTAFYLNTVSAFPSGMLYGANFSNNAGDATNDIDFAVGKAADSTNTTLANLAAMTKRLDANWAAGTNQGMRYSGAAITNTTYHLWAVWQANGANQDYYADPSATAATVLGHLQAETGGGSYLYLRRIGSIIRSGGAIVLFTQNGDLFIRTNRAVDIDAVNPGTSAVTATLSVPTGIVVQAEIYMMIIDSTAATAISMYVTPLVAADVAAGATAFTVASSITGSVSAGAAPGSIQTNTSGQVRYRLEGSNGDVSARILTMGWIDNRGRLG